MTLDLASLSDKYTHVVPCPTSAYDRPVYRAVQAGLGRTVAVHVLPRISHGGTGEQESQFRRGARGAAGLQHQNIIQVHDYEVTPTANLLVTEYVEGQSLAALLQQQGRLPVEQAFDIARQLADALDAAHANGRVHRNLKPAEILLTTRGRVKLGGFEAAVLPDDPSDEWHQEELLGNALFMSPEQVQRQPVTPRADVYALGVLVYLMLTGQHPITAARSWSVLYKKTTTDPAPPSTLRRDLPAEVDDLVLKLLRRAPNERFASMAEFRTAMEKLCQPVAAEATDEIGALVARRYPYPIAISYLLVGQELESAARFSRLLDVFEATLKYCSSAALLAALGLAADRFTSEVLVTLRRPSLGHWVKYLDIASRTPNDGAKGLLGRLGDFYLGRRSGVGRAVEIINDGVHVRNKLRGHAVTQTEQVYETAFQDLLPGIHALLRGLEFLTEYPLARVRRLRFTQGRFVADYNRCMGALSIFPIAEADLAHPVEEGAFGILDPDNAGMLELSPLIALRRCSICSEDEIVYYNGLRGRTRLSFLSYQKGHEFDDELPGNPFAARGIIWE